MALCFLPVTNISQSLSPSVWGLSEYWSSCFHLRHSRASSGAHSLHRWRGGWWCYTAEVQHAHSKAPIRHVFSPRRDWVALVWHTYAVCIHAWHQTGRGLYVTHYQPESLVQELSAAKHYLTEGKETAWWAVPTHPLLGQLFGVSVL